MTPQEQQQKHEVEVKLLASIPESPGKARKMLRRMESMTRQGWKWPEIRNALNLMDRAKG